MNRLFYLISVATILLLASAGVILLARGIRPDLATRTWQKTGMIAVKSRPDGAKVYLEGELRAVTNGSLAGLKEGFYDLKIVKEGFFEWEKEVEVKEELVTAVDALLIPLSPSLSPLTTSGIEQPTLSTNRDRMAFLKKGEKSGVYQLPLTDSTGFLGLLRGGLTPIVFDTPRIAFSAAEKIFWSPDDTQLLLEMNPAGFYLLKPGAGVAQLPEATATAAPTKASWRAARAQRNRLLSGKIALPSVLQKAAAAASTLWSPDEKKFLYQRDKGDAREYWVHDGSKPLGVARRRENFILRVLPGAEVNLSWFADSEQLNLVDPPVAGSDGTISLIEVDGGRKTPVYSGNLASSEVFPTPAGDKLLILTKFVESASPNLYAISLR